jgi:hypothetical protein
MKGDEDGGGRGSSGVTSTVYRGPEGGDVMATKKKPLSHPVVVRRQICSRRTAESHLRGGLLLAMIGLVLASCAPSDRDLLAGPNAVQHLAEGRPVDIPSAVANMRAAAGPFSARWDLVLPGRRAAFRVSGPRPTFLSMYPGPEIRLYRLEVGTDYDDRNLKTAIKGYGYEILRNQEVELEVSREGDSLYRVTPRGQLPPGEYAFVSQVDAEVWRKYPSKARLYSFGVD